MRLVVYVVLYNFIVFFCGISHVCQICDVCRFSSMSLPRLSFWLPFCRFVGFWSLCLCVPFSFCVWHNDFPCFFTCFTCCCLCTKNGGLWQFALARFVVFDAFSCICVMAFVIYIYSLYVTPFPCHHSPPWPSLSTEIIPANFLFFLVVNAQYKIIC